MFGKINCCWRIDSTYSPGNPGLSLGMYLVLRVSGYNGADVHIKLLLFDLLFI
jgi:hypothetical protein